MRRANSKPSNKSASTTAALAEAARLLRDIPATRRSGVLVRAVACFPEISLEASFVTGPLRAALSIAWEAMDGSAMSIDFFRQRLVERDDEQLISAICGVAFTESPNTIHECLAAALSRLMELHNQETPIERAKG